MLEARHWIRIVAAFLLMCGMVSLPSSHGSPKRITSLFSFYADSGAGFNVGLILIAAAVVLFLISLFLGKN
jgi:hypothetical protein